MGGLVLLGPTQDPAHLDPDDLVMTIRELKGNNPTNGEARDVDGGQWRMVMKIINFAVRNEWPVLEGMHILTGCLGKPILAKPGKYLVDVDTHHGALGNSEFFIDGEDT